MLRCKLCGEAIGTYSIRDKNTFIEVLSDENWRLPPVVSELCDLCFEDLALWRGRVDGLSYRNAVVYARPHQLKINEDDIVLYTAHKISWAIKRLASGKPCERCACMSSQSRYLNRCDRYAEFVVNGVPVCKQHKEVMQRGNAVFAPQKPIESPLAQKARELLA